MAKLLSLFTRQFFTQQFLLFVCVGMVNTFNGTLFATGLSWWLQANVAFVMGYMAALVIAFFINARFVFKKRANLRKFPRFALSYVPNFIIQNGVVVVVYNVLGWPGWVAFVLAAAMAVPVTFLLLKFFTFGDAAKSGTRGE